MTATKLTNEQLLQLDEQVKQYYTAGKKRKDAIADYAASINLVASTVNTAYIRFVKSQKDLSGSLASQFSEMMDRYEVMRKELELSRLDNVRLAKKVMELEEAQNDHTELVRILERARKMITEPLTTGKRYRLDEHGVVEQY